MQSPEYLMEIIRQGSGLKKDDRGEDAELQALTPGAKLRIVCGWTLGDPIWAKKFIEWAEDCGFIITS